MCVVLVLALSLSIITRIIRGMCLNLIIRLSLISSNGLSLSLSLRLRMRTRIILTIGTIGILCIRFGRSRRRIRHTISNARLGIGSGPWFWLAYW